MADQCTTTDDPPPEPPPPPIHTSFDLWHPGGDPGALRAAASAWRALAHALRTAAGDIDDGVAAVGHTWRGAAHDAFATWWTERHQALLDGADHADDVAATLDRVASEIERINHEVHELYLAIAATVAVSLVASIFTFGASTAAGAALTAANVARATTLVEGLASFLNAMRVGFEISRFLRFWRLWGVAVAVNAGATGVVKSAQGTNPFDPDNWSVRDITGVVVNADTGVLAAGLLGPGVVSGATGAAGGAVVTDVWLDDRDLFSTHVGVDALVAGATGGVASAAAAKGIDALQQLGRPTLGPALAPDLVVVHGSGTATSIDDLYLPGRPPPVGPPTAPVADGPVLFLPGQSHPHVLQPGRPVPSEVTGTLDNLANLTGSAAGTIGTWPLYGTGTTGPAVCMPPPPVLVGAR